ncbi:DNA ligase 3-like isoform X2 [Physella acuta]|uniref:DNA ligase 3-like isoform X2 n=1 Tax=Physella acuta TaxID=109671 RepID=UPI0027DB34D7|nr:DNA ligase 3-like isoform X2 [Physella acuta]
MAENKFVVGYAKLGTSSCKKCKTKIDKGALRLGKVTPNPFSDDGGEMKQWFHPSCLFETFVRARATTKKIEDPEDAEGFGDLEQEDKEVIKKLIEDYQAKSGNKTPSKPKKTPENKKPVTTPTQSSKQSPGVPSTSKPHSDIATTSKTSTEDDEKSEKDNSFREFRRLCAEIAEENSYLGKTNLVQKYITKGSSGDGFHGDLYLLIKHLLPGVVKTVYNLNNKQLVKLFSQIFGTSLQKMVEDLDQGDVAETVRIFFEESKIITPQKKSTLSLQEVDKYLEELSKLTREEEQQRLLTKITKRCTANDLKMFIRLIKHDLRINSGAKHILDAVDPNAYAAFQASRNLQDVIDRILENKLGAGGSKPGLSSKLSIRAALMTPVLPMLAEACRSVEQAMKKCPNGFYAEIKYDGERVQVHKQGHEFKYYSRSLKPVVNHKVQHFKDYIPAAFPTGSDLILDAEVLLVDNKTGNPLPFGTLGVHKKEAFKDATVCLFVFDCLLINNENLMEKPIKERRKILEKNMTTVKNHIHLSEIKLIKKPSDLQELMGRVFREGLEGLVLKDVNSLYEPGKRHWLKVKKDYLHEGKMADSADLVVLGAYYGTGNKGGMMSVFLLGVLDPRENRWVTVTKCGSGFDDKMLETLNKDLDMVKISKDFSQVPKWLNIKKPLTPDFVVADPKKAPVWEVIGAEFSQAEIHTADGISIRFPRVQKFRDDKTWKEATDLPRLKKLFQESKEKSDLNMQRALGKDKGDDDDDGEGSDDNGDGGVDVDNDTLPIDDSPSPVKESSAVKNVKKRPPEKDADDEILKKKKKPEEKNGTKKLEGSDSAKSVSSGTSKKSDLPNVFAGCKIVLLPSVPKHKELQRYILAFDGDLVHEMDAATATHVVLPSTDKAPDCASKVTKVSPDWLWACIRKKKLVPVEGFLL